MSKVLQRAMFKKQQHEHRSTGIASGLKYREGYAVGGRVGYATDQPGGIVNPALTLGGGIDLNKLLVDARGQVDQLYSNIEPMDYTPFATDYSKYKMDYDQFKPTALGAIGQAAGQTIGEPIPEGQSQIAKFFANLSDTSASFKERRQELDRLSQEDAKQMDLLTDESAKEMKIKTAEAIRNSGIADADRLADQYSKNIDVALTQRGLDIEAVRAQKGTDSALAESMKLVEDIVGSGGAYLSATEDSQKEQLRFAKADELANNLYLKEMQGLGEYWMENEYTGGDGTMDANDLIAKRKYIVDNMSSIYPQFNFELIVPKLATEELIDVDELDNEVSALSIFNPTLKDNEQKILSDGLINGDQDILLYNDLMKAKNEGKQFYEGVGGGTEPIEDILDLVIPLIQERYNITLSRE